MSRFYVRMPDGSWQDTMEPEAMFNIREPDGTWSPSNTYGERWLRVFDIDAWVVAAQFGPGEASFLYYDGPLQTGGGTGQFEEIPSYAFNIESHEGPPLYYTWNFFFSDTWKMLPAYVAQFLSDPFFVDPTWTYMGTWPASETPPSSAFPNYGPNYMWFPDKHILLYPNDAWWL